MGGVFPVDFTKIFKTGICNLLYFHACSSQEIYDLISNVINFSLELPCELVNNCRLRSQEIRNYQKNLKIGWETRQCPISALEIYYQQYDSRLKKISKFPSSLVKFFFIFCASQQIFRQGFQKTKSSLSKLYLVHISQF